MESFEEIVTKKHENSIEIYKKEYEEKQKNKALTSEQKIMLINENRDNFNKAKLSRFFKELNSKYFSLSQNHKMIKIKNLEHLSLKSIQTICNYVSKMFDTFEDDSKEFIQLKNELESYIREIAEQKITEENENI